jgi:peptide/nickel transport system ATP-binding protein/oligopeptide transport system ATP-binding protein
MNNSSNEPILQVNNLKTYFQTTGGLLKAVDDVSFYVNRGETLGIVGESGCGKSVTCHSIMRLVPEPPGRYEGGEILFDGVDVLQMKKKELINMRGSRIAMIFQEPMSSLNPVFTIANQMVEGLIHHKGYSKKDARDIALKHLEKVRIPNANKILDGYSFTLSGGMRQRVMIAMTMSMQPDILIADEPTTALDVTIQAQILELMKLAKAETGCAIIFITHDLGVISKTADRTMVMYAGKVCETAPTRQLINNPQHPYSRGLIASKPSGKPTANNRLTVIPGQVPSLLNKPSGCPFHPRCEHAQAICSEEFPNRVDVTSEHSVACWKYLTKEKHDA